jgi:hypothetical protein
MNGCQKNIFKMLLYYQLETKKKKKKKKRIATVAFWVELGGPGAALFWLRGSPNPNIGAFLGLFLAFFGFFGLFLKIWDHFYTIFCHFSPIY